jgi:NAD(P)-dependent dehydrogenase (short-subunit alcohol dehydrogenase family)
MIDLSGRTVVVTGGNSGLGLAMAHGVGRAGASVCLWSRTAARNTEAVADLSSAGISASAVNCDVADEQAVESAMAQTLGRHGAVDCLIANAGIGDARPFTDTSLDQWHAVLSTNLDGTFLSTRAAARYFVGAGRPGSIVVVSSMISRYGGAGQAAYAASKNGVTGLARTLAVELARHHVRVNILVPGWTATPMTAHLLENERFMRATTARTPVRRWGRPQDFATVAAFLADPGLEFHTGNEVVVDGGYTVF